MRELPSGHGHLALPVGLFASRDGLKCMVQTVFRATTEEVVILSWAAAARDERHPVPIKPALLEPNM